MAYKRRKARTYSGSRSRSAPRRATRARRASPRRSGRAAQRIVIQLVQPPGSVLGNASPLTLGQKTARITRSRF